MSSDTLRDQLGRDPFLPVILRLPSGWTVTVKNPELYFFTETGRTLIITEGDRFTMVDVPTIEALESTGSPAA